MSEKILVIRLSSLGDVVLTGPVYKSLKVHWPDAHVTVLVKPQYAPLLEGHPGVDAVITWRGFRDALRRIRGVGFTRLLDLHATTRSRAISAMSGIAIRTCYRKDALARRLFVAFGWSSPALQRHTVDRYLEALTVWGVPPISEISLHPGDWGGAGERRGASHVLVMQTSFLGDCYLTLPLLRRLKEDLPGTKIAVLTLPKHANIFRACEWVDEVILDDKRAAHSGLAGPWRIASELRKHAFDLAIIPHRSLRSALVAWLAHIPRRIGFVSSAGRFLLTDVVPFSWLSHDLERNLALAKPLGVDTSAHSTEARFIAQRPSSDGFSKLWEQASLPSGAKLIGIHPGAAWETKRWPAERFAQLSRRLIVDGFTPVLVGGPEDARLGATISSDSGAVNCIGRTSLDDLQALMSRFSLFVTNDSGPMHLAAGAGVPVVAIFGATTRELGFFPYGSGHRVVEAALECRPCGLHGGRVCPEGHFLCMRLLTVDQVYNACSQTLHNPAARALRDP